MPENNDIDLSTFTRTRIQAAIERLAGIGVSSPFLASAIAHIDFIPNATDRTSLRDIVNKGLIYGCSPEFANTLASQVLSTEVISTNILGE